MGGNNRPLIKIYKGTHIPFVTNRLKQLRSFKAIMALPIGRYLSLAYCYLPYGIVVRSVREMHLFTVTFITRTVNVSCRNVKVFSLPFSFSGPVSVHVESHILTCIPVILQNKCKQCNLNKRIYFCGECCPFICIQPLHARTRHL